MNPRRYWGKSASKKNDLFYFFLLQHLKDLVVCKCQREKPQNQNKKPNKKMTKKFTTWAQFKNSVDNTLHCVEGITTTDRDEAEAAVEKLATEIEKNSYNQIIADGYYVEEV